MFCTNCGNDVKEGSKFCNKCGAATKPLEGGPVNTVTGVGTLHSQKRLLIALAVVVPLVVALAFFAGYRLMQQNNRARVSQTWEDDEWEDEEEEDEGEEWYLSGLYELFEYDDYVDWDGAGKIYNYHTFYYFEKDRYTMTYIAGESNFGPVVEISRSSPSSPPTITPKDSRDFRLDRHDVTEGTYSISGGYIEFKPVYGGPKVFSFAKTDNTLILDGLQYNKIW
jgi:hypothetical protein